MRPIDYAIKLIVAYNMSNSMFITLSESLYYEEDEFIASVVNCLKENDIATMDAMNEIFSQKDEHL